MLFGGRLGREDDTGAFLDGQDLVGGDFGEAFDFLGGGPSYFDGVDDLDFAKAKMEAEIVL